MFRLRLGYLKAQSYDPLYSFFINNLPNSLTSKVQLFADDAIDEHRLSVYSEIYSISDSQIIQQDLDKSALREKTW